MYRVRSRLEGVYIKSVSRSLHLREDDHEAHILSLFLVQKYSQTMFSLC